MVLTVCRSLVALAFQPGRLAERLIFKRRAIGMLQDGEPGWPGSGADPTDRIHPGPGDRAADLLGPSERCRARPPPRAAARNPARRLLGSPARRIDVGRARWPGRHEPVIG